VGRCAVTDDCPGDRTCRAPICEPAVCRGDMYDVPAEPAALAARTHTGLVLCDGDEDVYRVTARDGEGLRVELRHDSGAGDLELRLAANGGGQDISASDGPYGYESVAVGAAAGVRDYQLTVRGRAGATVRYALSIARTGGAVCANDGFEGATGNDDAAHATRPGFVTPDYAICSGDQDWFVADVEAGTRLTARARPDDAVGALELALLNAGGMVLQNGAVQDGALVATTDVSTSGLYYARLRSGAAARQSGRLSLFGAPSPTAATDACAAAAELTPGVSTRLPARLSVDRLSTTCEEFPGEEDVYRFVLAAPARVTLALEGLRGAATMALRSTCANVQTEQSCTTGQPPVIRDVALGAGTWYVIVETRGELEPSLLLTTR